MPGVRLNFSGSGVSTTIGPRGATVTLGKRGARANLGMPGTGISYSTRLSGGDDAPGASVDGGAGCLGLLVAGALIFVVAKSCWSNDVTSNSTSPLASSTTSETVFVTASKLNCRDIGAMTGKIVEKLDHGTEVIVIARAAGWTQLSRLAGKCWVADDFISASAPPSIQTVVVKSTSRAPSPVVSVPVADDCWCSGRRCVGPRGGRYCITSGGNKRYGV